MSISTTYLFPNPVRKSAVAPLVWFASSNLDYFLEVYESHHETQQEHPLLHHHDRQDYHHHHDRHQQNVEAHQTRYSEALGQHRHHEQRPQAIPFDPLDDHDSLWAREHSQHQHAASLLDQRSLPNIEQHADKPNYYEDLDNHLEAVLSDDPVTVDTADKMKAEGVEKDYGESLAAHDEEGLEGYFDHVKAKEGHEDEHNMRVIFADATGLDFHGDHGYYKEGMHKLLDVGEHLHNSSII